MVDFIHLKSSVSFGFQNNFSILQPSLKCSQENPDILQITVRMTLFSVCVHVLRSKANKIMANVRFQLSRVSVMLLCKSELINSESLLLLQSSYQLRSKGAIFCVNNKGSSRKGIQQKQGATSTRAISRLGI